VTHNIILIVLDTVRADHLSCYGHHRETSPAIDEIAAEGIRYESAFANSNWTPTSHSTMFTGKLPSKTGVYGGTQTLPSDSETLPEFLESAGYHTHLSTSGAFIRPENGYGRGVANLLDAPKYEFEASAQGLRRAIIDS
jgi:arylsulfatase A-like enzyme